MHTKSGLPHLLIAGGAARAAWRPSPRLLLDAARVLAWRPAEPGWRARLGRARADRLPLDLGTPDEVRAADVPARRRGARRP